MYDYKVIPAPARAQKLKGLKTTPERFAHLLSETLNQWAAEGWEFLRAETLPCDERKGLTGWRTTTQSVLVLRRPRRAEDPARQSAFPAPSLRAEPAAPTPSLRAEREAPVLRAPVPPIGSPRAEGTPEDPARG